MNRSEKAERKNPVGRPKGKPRTKAELAADANRTGRPTLPKEERDIKLISLRLTPAEYELFTQDAEKAGMVRAAYARHCWRRIREIDNGNDIPQSDPPEKPENRKRGKRG